MINRTLWLQEHRGSIVRYVCFLLQKLDLQKTVGDQYT